MPRPGLLRATPKVLAWSRIVETGKLMATNAPRVPELDVLLTDSSANGCSRVCVAAVDRKSTRLNSSHLVISYAVFCLKKKKKEQHQPRRRRNLWIQPQVRRRGQVALYRGLRVLRVPWAYWHFACAPMALAVA